MQLTQNPVCDPSHSLPDETAIRLAKQLKALAHPVRLQILRHLANWEEGCCNDFCACIPLAQSTISQHLKILSDAEFVRYRPQGNCSQYSINSQAVEDMEELLDILRQLTKPRSENLAKDA